MVMNETLGHLELDKSVGLFEGNHDMGGHTITICIEMESNNEWVRK